MVKQSTLKEHLEEQFNIKVREVQNRVGKQLERKISALKGNIALAEKCLETAMVANSWKHRILEDFVFTTNASKEKIEKAIAKFYQTQNYELIERTFPYPQNSIINYKFQRGEDMKRVTLTYTPTLCIIIILKE